jgi:hypothetical protein
VGWVLSSLPDVLADFRAFYRLNPVDALELDSREFFSLVYRLPAFGGVIAHRVRAESQQESDAPEQIDAQDPVLEEFIA